MGLFRDLYNVELILISGPPIPHCLYYRSYIVNLEIWESGSSHLF